MDLETVDRELNAFIERRANARKEANAFEESWREPTRRRRRQQQRDNALAWADYYRSMAHAHHDMAARFAARADRILDQLGEQPKGAA